MSYYRTCPHCGAALDPGERCDCTLTQVCAEARTAFPERFMGRTDREIVNEIAAVVRCAEKKDTPAGAANTDEGGAEQIQKAVSASTITENGGFVK